MKSPTCRHDKKDLVLLYYGELDESDVHELDVRLGICPECREYMEQLHSMENVIPRSPSVEPPADVMEAIREATSRRLAERMARSRRMTTVLRPIIPRAAWARWSVALACAAVIFVAGRWSQAWTPETVPVPNGGAVADISNLEYDRTTGTISVQYSTTDDSAVQGRLSDERVRSLLTLALTEKDRPATRFRAVKILNDLDVDLLTPDPNLIGALIEMLRDDSNAGIQLQAIRALRRILDGAALNAVLTDLLINLMDTSSNSALRIEALEMLTASELARQDLNRVLARAARDENSFIRIQARNALDAMDESIPLDQIQ